MHAHLRLAHVLHAFLPMWPPSLCAHDRTGLNAAVVTNERGRILLPSLRKSSGAETIPFETAKITIFG